MKEDLVIICQILERKEREEGAKNDNTIENCAAYNKLIVVPSTPIKSALQVRRYESQNDK